MREIRTIAIDDLVEWVSVSQLVCPSVMRATVLTHLIARWRHFDEPFLIFL